MFPKIVIQDLEDLCRTAGVLKGILPTETEIIEEEFRRELNVIKKERVVGRERYHESKVGEQTYRKQFIHQTEKETKLTGADLAIEVEGQKLVFFQSKREGKNHRFQVDRRQMMQFLWLNDEIIKRTFTNHPLPHDLSYKVPCYYKLIFLKFTSPSPFQRKDVSIKEERYVPAKQVYFILGSRKSASSEELRTGYTPSEFQLAFEKCEVGSPDLIDEGIKRQIFFEYSKLTLRLVVFLSIIPS